MVFLFNNKFVFVYLLKKLSVKSVKKSPCFIRRFLNKFKNHLAVARRFTKCFAFCKIENLNIFSITKCSKHFVRLKI